MPQALGYTVHHLSRRSDEPRDKCLLSALLLLSRFLAVCPAPCQPSAGIHRHSGGKSGRIPGNAPSDILRIHRRKRRKCPRRFDKWRWPFRCRATYMPQPGGKFVRSPYREQCSVPSILGLVPVGRRLRNDHMLQHSRYRLRCRIGTVDAPWSSPGKNEDGSQLKYIYAETVLERGRRLLDLQGLSSSKISFTSSEVSFDETWQWRCQHFRVSEFEYMKISHLFPDLLDAFLSNKRIRK